METLEKSRVCRLCGKHSGISIDIFDKNDNHVKKINAILPILVHEMDLLPKHICHRCSYKLEEFHKFYIECLKTDTALKNQLSWMRKDTTNSKESIGVPMVQIENVKIKSEPHEMGPLLESVALVEFPMSGIESELPNCFLYTSFSNASRCQCYCDKTDPTGKAISKDCIHSHLQLQKRPNFSFLNETSEPQESELLRKKQRNLFGTSKEPRALSQSCNEKDSSRKSGARKLRPRRRSVNYVGTTRKNPSSESIERRTQSTEANLSDLVIKNEPLEGESPRVLRPRKQLEADGEKSRSKSTDCRKPTKSRCNSGSQEVMELKIKREIVDNTGGEDLKLDLRLKAEPENPSSPGSKAVFKKKDKFRALKEFIKNGGEFVDRARVKISRSKAGIDRSLHGISRDLCVNIGHSISKDGHIILKDGHIAKKEASKEAHGLNNGHGANRDGHISNKDGPNRDGPNSNKDGHGINKEEHSANKDGHSCNKEEHDVNKDGNNTNEDGHGTKKDVNGANKDVYNANKDGYNANKDGCSSNEEEPNPTTNGPSIKKSNNIGFNFFKLGMKSRKDFERNKDRFNKGGAIGKETLKAGKLTIKRSSKVHFSPKNLRSQDLHLRSGKVKVMNILSPKVYRKDFKSGSNFLEKFNDNNAKLKTKFLNLEVKHLCEKCNYTFANKELFRLHACYSN